MQGDRLIFTILYEILQEFTRIANRTYHVNEQSMFIWIRATFPRFRYDQIMRLGWKIFIPVTLVWLLVVGAWLFSPWNIWH